MRWLLFAVATVAIWSIGTVVFGINAMSECLPPFAPGIEECIADKRRDAVVIVVVTVALWLGFTFLIFRKRPTF